jgi:tetratricopeptide (TPR) repeat protein
MVLLINFFRKKKMQNSIQNFEIEFDKLLRLYLNEDELKRLDIKIIPSKVESNRVTEMINDFYRNQLEINIDTCNERIKIDRTITFSEKHLNPDKFCEFLLDMGRLCVTWGKLNFASELFRKTKKSSPKIKYQADSILELANVFSRKADWSRSLVNIAEAKKLYKKLNDKAGLAKCYNILAIIYGDRGEIDKAKKYILRSLSLIDPDTNLEMAANLNTNLGIIENIQGNKDSAKNHFESALLIYMKLGDQKRMAEVYYNIGTTLSDSKDYDSALNALDEGIEIAKNGSFILILCLIYLAKSQVLIANKDIASAAIFVEKALEISHSVDDKLTSADIFRVKGIIERHLQNYQLSESYLLNSLRINTSLKNEMNIAETSLELAILYKEMDKSKYEESYLQSALKYYKQIQVPQKIKDIEIMLGLEVA